MEMDDDLMDDLADWRAFREVMRRGIPPDYWDIYYAEYMKALHAYTTTATREARRAEEASE